MPDSPRNTDKWARVSWARRYPDHAALDPANACAAKPPAPPAAKAKAG